MNGKNFHKEDIHDSLLSLKSSILKCKEKLIKSCFWTLVIENVESEISKRWSKNKQCTTPKCVSRGECSCSEKAMFVIGLGSLESSFSSKFSSFYQLAAVLAMNEHFHLESIYFCDPDFTFLDSELIFELFMTYNTHVEVYSGYDLSILLNAVYGQLKNETFGRDKKINFLFFMPHCDRCVFGMLLHYFKLGSGKQLYSDISHIIIWGNNLDSFRIDSNCNFNSKCEYCKVLVSALSSDDWSRAEQLLNRYQSAFSYSFSDLSVYSIRLEN
ncbi:SRR1 family protein [Cryptosporidium felis]|nr:SRR1 family protein [Cryptosporidium felis]